MMATSAPSSTSVAPPATVSSPSAMTTTTTTTTTTAELIRNDDSNPQQGTGTVQPLATSPAAAAADSTLDDKPPMTNPVVVMSAPHRATLKVPPTKKDARKLFVGGLPSDITDAEFRAFFEQFGTLVDSIVMFDRDTHRSRGFGFVTFEDPYVCNRLLSMGGGGGGADGSVVAIGRLEMRGKMIEVKSAEPKDSAPNSRRHNYPRSSNNNNNVLINHNGGGGGKEPSDRSSSAVGMNNKAPVFFPMASQPTYPPYYANSNTMMYAPPETFPLASYPTFYPPMMPGYVAPQAYYGSMPVEDPNNMSMDGINGSANHLYHHNHQPPMPSVAGPATPYMYYPYPPPPMMMTPPPPTYNGGMTSTPPPPPTSSVMQPVAPGLAGVVDSGANETGPDGTKTL